MVEVKLRRKVKNRKEIVTVYLKCRDELREIEAELRRLGYLQKNDEILCYQTFSQGGAE